MSIEPICHRIAPTVHDDAFKFHHGMFPISDQALLDLKIERGEESSSPAATGFSKLPMALQALFLYRRLCQKNRDLKSILRTISRYIRVPPFLK